MDSGIEKICVIPLRFHSKHPFPTRNVIESSYRIRKIISSPLIPRSVRQQFCFEIILNDYLKKKKKENGERCTRFDPIINRATPDWNHSLNSRPSRIARKNWGFGKRFRKPKFLADKWSVNRRWGAKSRMEASVAVREKSASSGKPYSPSFDPFFPLFIVDPFKYWHNSRHHRVRRAFIKKAFVNLEQRCSCIVGQAWSFS